MAGGIDNKRQSVSDGGGVPPAAVVETLLTIEQAAAALQISPRSMTRFFEADRTPLVRVGRCWRILRQDWEAFLRRHRRTLA